MSLLQIKADTFTDHKSKALIVVQEIKELPKITKVEMSDSKDYRVKYYKPWDRKEYINNHIYM